MIKIAFGANKSPRSKVIRRACNSKYSHVWIVYNSGEWGGLWGAHANERGVVKERLDLLEKKYTKIIHFECPEEVKAGLKGISHHVGRADYDFLGVIINGLLLVAYRKTKWKFLWRLLSKNPKKLFCSELAAEMLVSSGVIRKDELNSSSTDPGTLFKFLSARKFFKSKIIK